MSAGAKDYGVSFPGGELWEKGRVGTQGRPEGTGPPWGSHTLSMATGVKGSQKMRVSWISAAC